MSGRSYYRNRALGVTGSDTPTCFPAALEQISPRHQLTPQAYEAYLAFIDVIDGTPVEERTAKYPPLQEAMYKDLLPRLGVSYESASFLRIKHSTEFRKKIGGLLNKGSRISIDIVTDNCVAEPNGYVHAVGVLPVAGTSAIKLRSTHVPFEISGIIQLDELFPWVAQIDEMPLEQYPFNDSNVVVLPR